MESIASYWRVFLGLPLRAPSSSFQRHSGGGAIFIRASISCKTLLGSKNSVHQLKMRYDLRK